MKLRIIAVLMALVVPFNAHAGFVTGAIVGAAIASDNSGSQSGSTLLLNTDHDVITCQLIRVNGIQYCTNGWDSPVTPQQFALKNGYSKVLHIGALITPKIDYIVMEVAK